ncbi:MAG: type I methionyl aminopeptidase [Alphaproteobacteria bacterium]|nr:type I methionyl aminopeptidase [Alphaproteobacteria bacterium]
MSYVPTMEIAATRTSGAIKLHGPEAFAGMRKAGRVSAECLDMLAAKVVPGVTTQEIDDLVYDFVSAKGALPATIFYRGYRHASCTSINEVVCHGMPSDRELKDGDIINIDVTSIVDGWHGDTSRMYLVGDPVLKARRLVDVTYEAMMRGIQAIKPGATTGDIGHAIQAYAEAHSYAVVRDFCGHGVGQVFHDAPNILHYGRSGAGLALREGMIFTVEPMINAGKYAVKLKNDGWTAVTKDRSLSAQFEHTVGVTATGVEIFTASPLGLHKPPYA